MPGGVDNGAWSEPDFGAAKLGLAATIVIKSIEPAGIETLLVEFKPIPGSKLGELAANFDVVLGRTAAELDDGTLRGVAPPGWQMKPGYCPHDASVMGFACPSVVSAPCTPVPCSSRLTRLRGRRSALFRRFHLF